MSLAILMRARVRKGLRKLFRRQSLQWAWLGLAGKVSPKSFIDFDFDVILSDVSLFKVSLASLVSLVRAGLGEGPRGLLRQQDLR